MRYLQPMTYGHMPQKRHSCWRNLGWISQLCRGPSKSHRQRHGADGLGAGAGPCLLQQRICHSTKQLLLNSWDKK